MHAGPRRLVLPRFTLTETAEGPGDGVSKIGLRDGTFYYVRDKFTDAASSRVDGKPDWVERRIRSISNCPKRERRALGRSEHLDTHAVGRAAAARDGDLPRHCRGHDVLLQIPRGAQP